MAKKYLVKVYSKTGAYLNTWDEVISDMTFVNEINTAGGQMTINLARNAGDYGEGSDIDFGFKVVVYVFDKELPNGSIVFQGYISSYTPIYKDNSVTITVLSYGSQFNDYVIEGGEAADLSLTKSTTSFGFGGTAAYISEKVAQTFTATATIQINTIEIYAKTIQGYNNSTGLFFDRSNITLTAIVRTGTTVESGTVLGTFTTIVLDGTERRYKMTTTDTVNITNASTYNIVFYAGTITSASDQYTLAISGASAYAGGSPSGYYYTI